MSLRWGRGGIKGEKMEIKILKQIEVVSLDTIHLYPENPREMEASQFKSLKKSIIEYGFIDPLIVNKRTHLWFGFDFGCC
jgi:hypothetical protein